MIEHFGSWNTAKRAAGLVPRRFATRDELLGLLRELGEELGRVPTAKDLDARRSSMPSKSLYWHTFGSLTTALREAGFDVPVGEERLERAVDAGRGARAGPRPPAEVHRLGRGAAGRSGPPHRVAGLPDVRRPPRRAWSTFQYLVAERLGDEGVTVRSDGALSGGHVAAVAGTALIASLAAAGACRRRCRLHEVVAFLDTPSGNIVCAAGPLILDPRLARSRPPRAALRRVLGERQPRPEDVVHAPVGARRSRVRPGEHPERRDLRFSATAVGGRGTASGASRSAAASRAVTRPATGSFSAARRSGSSD